MTTCQRVCRCIGWLALGFLQTASGQEVRSAGTLFVSLDATNLAALAEGAYVASWTNRGTLAEFVPAYPGKGATFTTNAGGAAALQFNGTADSVMALAGHTNNATAGGVPASILGTNVWSAEVWVYNPAGSSSIETLLAWTSRRSADSYKLMELRYYNSTDAIEHYARNLGWGSVAPSFGQWHHVACTRSESFTNSIYVDGRLVNTLYMGSPTMLNLNSANALFGIGAVDSYSGWTYPFSGAIAVVRVHDGTLSADDVLNNFNAERSRFGGGWQNAGAGAWSEPANWENGALPKAGSPVYISNGGTAAYDGAPYAGGNDTAMLLALRGGMNVTGGKFTALPMFNEPTIRFGTGAGNAFTLGLAGGTFSSSGSTLRLGDTAAATGTVSLASGGRLSVPRIQKGSGAAFLTADGGVLEATASAADFLQSLNSAQVKAGGLTFDVPTNVSVTVGQAMQEDLSSPGGGLSKTGTGALTLTGANSLKGPLSVTGGSLLIQSGALATNYAAPVSLANGATIGWNQAGGAASIASNLTAGSAGSLTLFVPNANESIDFSTFPDMKLLSSGSFTYTGTLIPYANLFRFAPDNGTVTFSQTINNLPELPGRVECRGTASGFVKLTGDNSYTGGTLLVSGGITMGHAHALGTGTDGVQDIVCRSGTALRVQAVLDGPAFFGRVQADPVASLQLSGAGLNNTIDLSACPNLFTGTENISSKSYLNGVLTPYGSTYLLGNSGVDGYVWTGSGLVITNLSDGPGGEPRGVLIRGIGAVDTRENASYSGGTRVEDGGRMIVIGDRGFGTVPGVFDPSNIVFNGGTFRTERQFVTTAPTRGIVFGPKGATIHASGTLPAQLMIPGSISGSGTLHMTDWGWVTFAGTNNSYSGQIQLDGNVGAVMIGDGTNFSWTSTGGIVGTASSSWLYLNNGGENTFSDSFSGNGILTKKGEGAVTLMAAQANKQLPNNTVVEKGILRYGISQALCSGTNAGSVAIQSGAFLDLNGFSPTVNGLTGLGCVTNGAAAASAMQVGAFDAASWFSGLFATNVTLTKIGTNTLTLSHLNPTRQPVTVSAGTLALDLGVALTNGIAIAGGAAVQAVGYKGLRAEYYDNVFPPSGPVSWPELGTTPAAIEALLAGRLPDLVTDCSSFGDVFSSGASGQYFPGKYSGGIEYFVTRWTGTFTAEEAGLYEFSVFADDGCLLFLDGELVVNNRTGSGTASGSKTLEQRDYAILVFFFEKSGVQAVTVQMKTPSGTLAPLPQRLLSSPTPVTVGNLSGTSGSRLEVANYGRMNIVAQEAGTVGSFGGTGVTNAVIDKLGSGVLTLTGTSSFRGLTRITEGGVTLSSGASHTGALHIVGGTLTVSGGTSVDTAPVWLGPLSAAAEGTLALAAKTMLRINQTTNGAFAGAVTGGTADSVIAKAGAAELVVTGDASAYPGTWDVLAGSLVIGEGGALASAAVVNVRTNGTLVFRSASDITFSGTLTGTGVVRNDGPGVLTLTGSISSALEIPAGQTILIGGAAGQTWRVPGVVTNNGTLRFDCPGGLTISAPIAGTGVVSVASNTVATVMSAGLLSGDASLRLDGGTLTLHSGGTAAFNAMNWVTNGVSRFTTNTSGAAILEANPNIANTAGSAFHKLRVPATNAWELNTVWRKGTGGGCGGGDGFAVMFQNDARGTNALGSSGSLGISTITPSFGYRFYLFSQKFAWVVNGSVVGEFMTNLFSWGGGNFTANLAFDGNQLAVAMQQGTKTLTVTNTNARALLAAVGAQAYVGLGSGTGGCYGQQFIDAFSFSSLWEPGYQFTNDLTLAANSASTVQADAPAVDGLPLAIGDLTFEAGSSLTAAPAEGSNPSFVFARFGNLNVRGNSALTIDELGWASIGGAFWTFTPGAVLTVTGTVTLPDVVHVAIDGETPPGRTDLADFRDAEITNLASVQFVLDNDDGKTHIVFRDGILYVSRIQGTVIHLR